VSYHSRFFRSTLQVGFRRRGEELPNARLSDVRVEEACCLVEAAVSGGLRVLLLLPLVLVLATLDRFARRISQYLQEERNFAFFSYAYTWDAAALDKNIL
jgi:hypothetical protein